MNSRMQDRATEAASEPVAGIDEEQARRAGLYALLAALMRDAPDAAVLDYLAGLDGAADGHANELLLSLAMLALSARTCDVATLREEYHELFIGLGRGELVPYGSWYQTGFLNERPLSELRDDLARLGFEREDEVHEPEDHVAALCEVMALLIQEGHPLEEQHAFFDAHLAPWVERFFADLAEARSAVFYRAVARFGRAFLAIESRYLNLLD
jgi:TorA maturation chaperone TorD